MADNPIMEGKGKSAKIKRTAQEWCDIGNDRLAGRIPYSDGRYEVRRHLKWIVDNGGQPKLIQL